MIFDEFPFLENPAVVLRRMTLSDAPALLHMKEEREVYRYEPSFLPELLSADVEAFLRKDCDRLFREKKDILLGIYRKEEPERLIGISEFYGYDERRSKVSFGIRLMKEWWNQGYATMVIALMKDYALKTLGLQRLTAHIISGNIGSEKAFLKNSFVKRRNTHPEDWGLAEPVSADKLVIYPEDDLPEE